MGAHMCQKKGPISDFFLLVQEASCNIVKPPPSMYSVHK